MKVKMLDGVFVLIEPGCGKYADHKSARYFHVAPSGSPASDSEHASEVRRKGINVLMISRLWDSTP